MRTYLTYNNGEKAKVGDKIIAVVNPNNCSFKKGAIATVVEVPNTHQGLESIYVGVVWDRKNGLAGNQMNGEYRAHHFNKIKKSWKERLEK